MAALNLFQFGLFGSIFFELNFLLSQYVKAMSLSGRDNFELNTHSRQLFLFLLLLLFDAYLQKSGARAGSEWDECGGPPLCHPT